MVRGAGAIIQGRQLIKGLLLFEKTEYLLDRLKNRTKKRMTCTSVLGHL